MSNNSAEHAPGELIDTFNQNYDTAQQIDDQNKRYTELAADDVFADYEDIREVAVGGVANEQSVTLAKLHDLDTQAYSDIAARYNGLEAEHAAMQDDLARTEADELRKQKMLAAVERAIALSPTATDDVRELEAVYLVEMDDERRQKLKLAAEALGQDISEIAPIFEAAARPWPLPLVPQESVETTEREDDETLYIEDILPVESQTHEMNETARRLVEHYGHTSNASVMATVYLMEHAGRVLTPLDIGHEVYSESEEFDDMSQNKADKVIHARILTLLNENSGRVAAMLEDEGYTLLYGHRVIRTASGKQLGPARRIYRTVKTSEDPYAPTSFVEEVTKAGHVIGINEAATKDEIRTLDVEHEPAVQLADIDEIEKTVAIAGKHDKWSARVDELMTEIEALLPWLEQQGLMPRALGGGINPARVKAVMANKRNLESAPFRLTQGTMLSAQHGVPLNFATLVNGLLGRDKYKGAPDRYTMQAYKRTQQIEEQYFNTNES